MAGNPLGAGFENPTKILEWLQAAGNDVTKVGSEEVRGQPADHYRTTLNLRDAIDQLEGDARDKAEEALELLGDAEFPINVWVNEDGLPVRLTYDMSLRTHRELLKTHIVTHRVLDGATVPSTSRTRPTEELETRWGCGLNSGRLPHLRKETGPKGGLLVLEPAARRLLRRADDCSVRFSPPSVLDAPSGKPRL